MYPVGHVLTASEDNPYTCPKCNQPAKKIIKIDTHGWRCLPCWRKRKEQALDHMGSRARGGYAPLGRELFDAQLGIRGWVRQKVEDEEGERSTTETLPRKQGDGTKRVPKPKKSESEKRLDDSWERFQKRFM